MKGGLNLAICKLQAVLTPITPLNPNPDLQQIVRHDALRPIPASERKFLWMVRSHLMKNARALPKVMASIPRLYTPALLREVTRLLNEWATPTRADALELLHQRMANMGLWCCVLVGGVQPRMSSS